jgi:hypothetical protein
MLPNFIVIGAPKCGTTTFCKMLSQHQDVFFCIPKEPAFFSRDEVFKKGITWYKSLFKNVQNELAIGEGTTGYSTSMYDRVSARRISETIPNARLIYCVRNPIRRIESIWMDYVSSNGFKKHENGIKIYRNFSKSVRENNGFVATSLYWDRLNVYRHKFPDKSIHIVFFEDMINNPKLVLSNALKFLKCNPDTKDIDFKLKLNVSQSKKMPTNVGSFIDKMPGSNRINRFLGRIAPSLHDKLTKKPMIRPYWNKIELKNTLSEMKEKNERFLSFCDKQIDFWNFEEELDN